MKTKTEIREIIEKAKQAHKEQTEKNDAQMQQKIKDTLEKMIPKDKLEDGKYYIGEPEFTRHGNIMMWDATKQMFLYIRYKFGYRLDYMDYFGDVAYGGRAGFAPYRMIEE